MVNLVYRQSSVCVVRADTPILQCVEKMRDRNIGAILIVSDDAREELIGIFTERDLLKSVPLLAGGNFFQKPIRTVMTKNPITISPEQLGEADTIMVKKGLRHLPIAIQSPENNSQLVGLVSMRDLFKSMVSEQTEQKLRILFPVAKKGKSLVQKQFGLLSRDASLGKFFDESFSHLSNVVQRKIPHKIFQSRAAGDFAGLHKFDFLVFDIDEVEAKIWAPSLKKILTEDKIPPIFLVFTPEKHEEKELLVLQKLDESKKLHLFAKPIDLVAFSELVSPLLH